MRIASGLAIAVLMSSLSARTLVTPLFPHKDGEASATKGYAGSEKDLLVSGLDNYVGWMTFQTQGIELTSSTKATLSLYVKSMKAAGTLKVYALDSALSFAENNVKYADLKFTAASPLASTILLTGDVEKVLQIDVTSAVQSGKFNGIALVSSDLEATFDSKEGNLKPVIMLSYGDVTASWLDSSGQVKTQGKVGIGKSPATALDVAGTVTATTFVGDGSGLENVSVPAGSISATKIAAGAIDNSKLAANSVDASKLQDSSITGAKINSNTGISFARVLAQQAGIGTTSPIGLLNIRRDGRGPWLYLQNDSANKNAGIYFGNGAPGPNPNSSQFYIFRGWDGSSPNQLNFGYNNSGNWNTYLTLSDSGNFGIGTNTPKSLLDVNGNTNINGNLSTSGTVIGKALVFQAMMNADWVRTSQSWSRIPFNQTVFNTIPSVFDSANNRYTPLIAGYYSTSVTGFADHYTGSGDRYALTVEKNGVFYAVAGGAYPIFDCPMSTFTKTVFLNGSTDYLEAHGFTSIPATWAGSTTPGSQMLWNVTYLGK